MVLYGSNRSWRSSFWLPGAVEGRRFDVERVGEFVHVSEEEVPHGRPSPRDSLTVVVRHEGGKVTTAVKKGGRGLPGRDSGGDFRLQQRTRRR